MGIPVLQLETFDTTVPDTELTNAGMHYMCTTFITACVLSA